MAKRIAFLVMVLTWVSINSPGQNFIGMHADEIKAIMKQQHPGFLLNTSIINRHFNYLKYENEEGTQTMLIFLNEQDRCKYYKRICDYVHLPEMTVQLNANSRRENDSLWVFQDDHRNFSQVLIKGDWFFTITTRPLVSDR